MPQKSSNILINSRIIVGMMAMVLLVLGLLQIGQGMIDTRAFRDRVIQAVKDQTGVAMTVKGNVSVSLVPMPTFYFPQVELRGGDDEPSVTVEMLIAKVSLFSLFSGQPHITGLALDRPVVEVERTHDNVIHWGWLKPGLLKTVMGSGAAAGKVSLAVDEGRILYHNNYANRELAAEQVSFSGVVGHRTDLSGTMRVNNHALRLKAAIDDTASGPQPLSITFLTDDDSKLSLEGTVDLAAELPKIHGTFTLAITDIGAWFEEKVEEKHALFDKITHQSTPTTKENTALPVTFSADWAQDGSAVNLTQAKWSGLNSVGEGSISLTFGGLPSATINMAFSAFDTSQWTQTAVKIFQSTQQASASAYGVGDEPQENPLPQDVQIILDVSAQKLMMGGQAWQNARMQAQLDDGAVTVNQFNVTLPGDTSLAMFGVVSHDAAKGLRFEGSMETNGKSLRQFLTLFDASAADLPETGLGAFYAHSNIFVSPEQLRLSEADVKINDLSLSGGLVAYYDTGTRLEADVRLKDINFDYFRDVWRAAAGQSKNRGDFLLAFDKNASFNWLKRLQATVDFKVNVDGFTFLERKGSNASFRLFAREGQFGIYDIRFFYPTETMEANFTLDVTGAQPVVKLLLNANEFNLDYFRPAPAPAAVAAPAKAEAEKPADAAASAPKVWSEDLIDMGWMEGLGGVFDISVGTLTSGDKTLSNLKLKATLDNNLLALQSLSFLYWQGKWDVRGSVYGGKVPGVSLGFTIFDAELHDILKAITNRDNITGRVSVSGTLATSGVNPLSWVEQADAKLVMTGRGVDVKGFNLQGVVDTVNESRTAADVFANVNRAVRDGNTSMSVDGNLNMKNGVAKTPGITLKAGTITGNLTGDIKLVPWSMDLSTLFQFPSMPSETIPTMTLRLDGSIDKPELQVDTASLEAYVAKRIVGK